MLRIHHFFEFLIQEKQTFFFLLLWLTCCNQDLCFWACLNLHINHNIQVWAASCLKGEAWRSGKEVKQSSDVVFNICRANSWGWGTPLYELYRYVWPQRVWFFGCFGHN